MGVSSPSRNAPPRPQNAPSEANASSTHEAHGDAGGAGFLVFGLLLHLSAAVVLLRVRVTLVTLEGCANR